MLTSLCFLIQESYIASKSIAEYLDDDDDCDDDDDDDDKYDDCDIFIIHLHIMSSNHFNIYYLF